MNASGQQTSVDACPACGAEWPATMQVGTVQGTVCECQTPLIREIAQAWRINVDTEDGRDVQRALNEGWKRCDDGKFEPDDGRLVSTLAQLREGWRPWVNPGDELRGGQ
jgi:hypothetical protein